MRPIRPASCPKPVIICCMNVELLHQLFHRFGGCTGTVGYASEPEMVHGSGFAGHGVRIGSWIESLASILTSSLSSTLTPGGIIELMPGIFSIKSLSEPIF